MSEQTAYPLYWPPGRPRTFRRRDAAFKTSFDKARRELLAEIGLLGGKDPIISTDLPLRRRDGIPYSDVREPIDPGVGVYFEYQGQRVAFACDRWTRVRDNLHAIELTIAALRGIARWGTGDMVKAAFAGFRALPPAERPWREILGLPIRDVSAEEIESAFREKAKQHHPDVGGDHAAMAEITSARTRALAEIG